MLNSVLCVGEKEMHRSANAHLEEMGYAVLLADNTYAEKRQLS